MFRNEELQQDSTRASCKTLGMLVDLGDQGKRQQETLASVAVSSHANAGMLKILSAAATIYLPASLVAVSLTK